MDCRRPHGRLLRGLQQCQHRRQSGAIAAVGERRGQFELSRRCQLGEQRGKLLRGRLAFQTMTDAIEADRAEVGIIPREEIDRHLEGVLRGGFGP